MVMRFIYHLSVKERNKVCPCGGGEVKNSSNDTYNFPLAEVSCFMP